jgi:hypothetical protein
MPLAIGAGVLGLSVAAVLVVRGDKSRSNSSTDRPAIGTPSGSVRISIASQPPEADVYQDGELVRRTPAQLQLTAGAEVSLELRKPGYAPARHTLVAPAQDTALPVFTLAPINGFEGVWQLPTKELRAFKRSGEKVEVSKLDSVGGPRTFFRHYELLPSEGGLAFGTTEEVVDQRAPYDPSCHVPHKVEYQYDPQTDALVVRRERVIVDMKDGHCVVMSSEIGNAEPLLRVDRGVSDARETYAPVGKPSFDNVKEPPIDQQKLDEIEKKTKSAKRPPSKKPVKQKVPPPGKVGFDAGDTQPKTSAVGNDQKNASQKIVPNPPPPQAPPPAQKQAQKQATSPANVSKPRGDSQVAPQQAEFPPEQKK